MINLVFDKDIFKILTVFSISPGSRFRRNELKEKLILNNIPLDNALLKLIKQNLIKQEKKLYSINFENSDIKLILEAINKQYKFLKEIPLNVYFLLIDLISNIKLIKSEIYLFGSYSKLIYKEDSDIDIAILDKSFKKESINQFINKLEKKYKKEIQLHIFDKKEFYKNKKDPLVKDIIKNGVRLN